VILCADTEVFELEEIDLPWWTTWVGNGAVRTLRLAPAVIRFRFPIMGHEVKKCLNP